MEFIAGSFGGRGAHFSRFEKNRGTLSLPLLGTLTNLLGRIHEKWSFREIAVFFGGGLKYLSDVTILSPFFPLGVCWAQTKQNKLGKVA